jgi:hypothetical protein
MSGSKPEAFQPPAFFGVNMRWYSSVRRWTAPLVAGFLSLLGLSVLFWINVRGTDGGLGSLITAGLKSSYGMAFALKLAFAEILPIYLMGSLLACLTALLLGSLCLDRGLRSTWTWRQGFMLSLAGLVFMHWVYWWEVPTALWVIPGLARLPLLVALLLVLGSAIGLALAGFRKHGQGWGRRMIATLLCLFAWGLMAEFPLWLAKARTRSTATGHPVKALWLGIDGLRGDFTGAPEFKAFHGVSYPNVYTPLPATRMLYHLLWGGDPEFYSIATVVPSMEELGGEVNLRLLLDAKGRGQKVRLFFDDGGTISVSGRSGLFDQVTMPARGWENFVNSNLAVRVPLFAAWLDILRVFPTTNPWTDPAAGLHRALEQGRGSDWVIYHSCLAHQPIYLSRSELAQVRNWWWIPGNRFKPLSVLNEIEEQHLSQTPPVQDPYRAYRIRIQTILKAWAPMWNNMASDPDYQGALRVLTSDHGERFYHATSTLRLAGVHGYGLDPWEIRVPLVTALPGHDQTHEAGPTQALSLLNLRDVVNQVLTKDAPPRLDQITAGPFAPARFHTLAESHFRKSLKEYREYTTEGIIRVTYILPDGLWAMFYEKPARERGADVSLAMAVEDYLTVYKPLKGGGAEKTEFRGYEMISQGDVGEAEFQKYKALIEAEFFRTPWNQPNSATPKRGGASPSVLPG